MSNRHRFIKLALRGCGLYFIYNIVEIVRKERVLQEARIIKEQQVRYGADIELSEDKKQILRKAEEYIDNHAGYRYLNRMRTEKFFEQRFQNAIREKQKALQETSPEDEQKRQKLKGHLQQLNSAYNSVLPKIPASWDELREMSQEED